MALPLSRPSLRRQHFDQVLEALVHDRLTSGELNTQLAKTLAKAWSLKDGQVFASVTDAVNRLVDGLELRPGDRVALSPLAPAYWADLLPRCGLVPVFVDVLPDSPVLDPVLVEEARDQGGLRAVVADCCLGYLPDVTGLRALGLTVIEDLSHGLGGDGSESAPGTQGNAVLCVFSPETLIAGAGGAFAGLRQARPGAAAAESWALLSDLGASLILSQWDDLGDLAGRKREQFRLLFLRLAKGYSQPKQAGDARPVHPWFPVLVESGAKDVLSYSRKEAVEADWAFRRQGTSDPPSGFGDCPHARSFLFRSLIFPLYATLSTKELERLAKVLSSLP